METTVLTWFVAVGGLVLIGILTPLQLIAVFRPRAEWTIKNVYGSSPDGTDPTAYFAWNQGGAWADPFLWAPLQIAGSIGMLLGERWGFLLVLMASVPFWYSAVWIYIWDRDMGFRERTFTYWSIWAVFPAYGILASVYTFVRLLD